MARRILTRKAGNTMAATRVFVVWSNRLAREAAESLLHEAGIVLLGAERDLDRAQAQIAALHPDVVLVEGEADGGMIEHLLTSADTIQPRRLVRFTLRDNDLAIYQRQVQTVARAEDFIAIVTKEDSP